MNLYPYKLLPVNKEAIWGGYRLGNGSQKIAESWVLTVREKEKNIICNGEYNGRYLNDILDLSKPFPILIKFIDANDKLSVQVHPDGKTEMWYIIEASPDAKIVYGFIKDMTDEEIYSLIDNGCFEDCLNYINVKSGEAYFIPAGLVHAIGSGILIAEIQQNSDTTYRFYDYNRTDMNGNKRELHIDKAIEVCDKQKSTPPANLLPVSCEYFNVCKYRVETSFNVINSKENNTFHSLLCIDGGGIIKTAEGTYPFTKGDSYFIPAGMGEYSINGTSEIIFTTP